MDCELEDFAKKKESKEPVGQREEPDEQPLLRADSSLSDGSSTVASTESIEELEKKYAPYVRRDVYGPMGRGNLPFREKLLLGISLFTLVPVRFVAGMIILVVYYLICRVCTMFKDPNREEEQEDYAHMVGWRREAVVRSGRLCARAMLFVFGFYRIKDSSLDLVDNEHGRPGAVVSNHVSHIDILYHMSSSFPSFVAKRESKSSDSKGVSGIITDRVLEAHENDYSPIMMLFPEGTTTNGDFLLPFKTGAFLAKAPVLPVILRYPYRRFSPAWDSISGVRHVLFLLCQFVNHIEVTRFPVYYPSEEEMKDPKLYACNVRKMMAKEGNLTLSEIGLAEKRIYHAALNGNGLPRVSSHDKED